LTENLPTLFDGSPLPMFFQYDSVTRTFNIQTLDPLVSGNYTIAITTFLNNVLNILNPTFTLLIEVRNANQIMPIYAVP
jgi:hypothetical protein